MSSHFFFSCTFIARKGEGVADVVNHRYSENDGIVYKI